jgi:hypothetical protein
LGANVSTIIVIQTGDWNLDSEANNEDKNDYWLPNT